MKIVTIILLFSGLCFAQVHKPLPAVLVCEADEPDIHTRIPEAIIKQDETLLKKIDEIQSNAKHYDIQNAMLRQELKSLKEQQKLEKKIAGIAGLLLFASGNETLKNVGLVSLFCYSIW